MVFAAECWCWPRVHLGGWAFAFLLPEYEIWLPMHGYQSVMNANSTQQNIPQYAEGPIFLEEHATPPPPSMTHTANIALSTVSNSHPCISCCTF